MTGDICLHLLQYCHPHGLPQRGLFPYPIGSSPWFLTRNTLFHPVMETPQYPPNVGVHYPVIRYKEQDGLCDGQV